MLWQVEYAHLVPIVVKGIQELDMAVDSHTSWIATAEERMAALEKANRILQEENTKLKALVRSYG